MKTSERKQFWKIQNCAPLEALCVGGGVTPFPCPNLLNLILCTMDTVDLWGWLKRVITFSWVESSQNGFKRTCAPPWQEPEGSKSHILLHEGCCLLPRLPNARKRLLDLQPSGPHKSLLHSWRGCFALIGTSQQVLQQSLLRRLRSLPPWCFSCKHCRPVAYCLHKQWLLDPFGRPPAAQGLQEFDLIPWYRTPFLQTVTSASGLWEDFSEDFWSFCQPRLCEGRKACQRASRRFSTFEICRLEEDLSSLWRAMFSNGWGQPGFVGFWERSRSQKKLSSLGGKAHLQLTPTLLDTAERRAAWLLWS